MDYQPSPLRYQSGMTYGPCGRSGLRLPALSLGLWHNFGSVNDYATAKAILLHAFDRGITHFDLANNYGPEPGTAEINFGRMLKESLSPYRDEIIVSTKAGHAMWEGPYGDGSSRKNLMASLDQSLRRMGLDYVDIFYSHRYDSTTPLEETAATLADIVHRGKALYVGISKYPAPVAEQMYALLEKEGIHCLVYQGRYSMISRDPEEKTAYTPEGMPDRVESVLDGVVRRGIGFVAFSPLAQGLLTDRYLRGIPKDSRAASSSVFLTGKNITPELLRLVGQLNDIAAGRNCTMAQLALRWLLDKPAVTSVLVGASSVAQLNVSLGVLDTEPFSGEEIKTVNTLLDGYLNTTR